MFNASSCTVELWIHLEDILGGLLSSQELEVSSLMSYQHMLNGNMKHACTVEFHYANILAMLLKAVMPLLLY